MDDSPNETDSRRVVEYWNTAHALGEVDTFLAHPLVRVYMSLRAIGSLCPHIDAVFDEVDARSGPGDRILSVGCGAAYNERHLATRFPDRTFVGIDIADETLEAAREQSEAAGITNLELEQHDFNNLDLIQDEFALVLGIAAIHHVENLEGFWDACAHGLRPGGAVVAQEYIGASRFQWTDAQLELGCQVLSELPCAHTVHHSTVRRIPVEVLVELDPSEAVRSDELMSTLKQRLKLVSYHGAGCGLLQPVLIDQLHTFDPTNWQHNTLLAKLFEREEEWMKSGALTDSFAMFTAEV